MLFGLTDENIKKIREVFAHYPQLKEVILYGSRAKGTFKHGSDIDLTLKGTSLDLALLSRISDELDLLLLPYTFDLSIFKQISNQNLLDHIARVGRVFYIPNYILPMERG
ncbi:nucleotidyltransferase domain-containing protein [Simkania negevensis]|uniref:Nucleotidyltransferase domain-containing protein n=1 Tax=Simkania negevensis TaxID=83561 RepID=A0ABS3ARR5_9BACT|nr:nucleotidyltransferase domain-containing protein [Simkania negevensis]